MAAIRALGALQLATILATPIAKYVKKTDSHSGGLAVVGDGGRREVVLTDRGYWLTPDTRNLIDMPEGASVLRRIDAFNNQLVLRNMPTFAQATKADATPVIVNNDYKPLERHMGELKNNSRKK